MEENSSHRYCPKCDLIVDSTVQFCGHCGSDTYEHTLNDPHIGEVVAGRYRIKKPLARGGMAKIYIAEHEMLAHKVAVKLLHPYYASDGDIVARFFNEARSMCRINHPHVVSVLDFGRLKDGTLYLVTEFIKGVTLYQFISDAGALSESSATRLSRQIAEALVCAHEAQIIHRDLKPENVMITKGAVERHSAKLLDFGIAKRLDDATGKHITESGVVFGTPAFMSPEQAQGLPLGTPTDIYSFGALLFYMLTGSRPFEGQGREELVLQLINEPVPFERLTEREEISPGLVTLVKSCMEKSPSDRPPSFLSILTSLENIKSGTITSTPQESKPVPVANENPTGESFEWSAVTPELGQEEPSLSGIMAAIPRESGPSEPQTGNTEPLDPKEAPTIKTHGETYPATSPDKKTREGSSEERKDGFSWGNDQLSPDALEAPVFSGNTDAASAQQQHQQKTLKTWFSLIFFVVTLALVFLLVSNRKTQEDAPLEEGLNQPHDSALLEPLEDNAAEAAPEEFVPPPPLPQRPFQVVSLAWYAAQSDAAIRRGAMAEAAQFWSQAETVVQAIEAQEVPPVGEKLAETNRLISQAERYLNEHRCDAAQQKISQVTVVSPPTGRRLRRQLTACREYHENLGLPPLTLD